MEYIKVSKHIGIDYIPKERNLCDKCIYLPICPFDWYCDTEHRMNEYYDDVDNDDTDKGSE